MELSKDFWGGKSASLTASDFFFSEILEVDLGGCGEVTEEDWCSLAGGMGGCVSIGWVAVLCFFFAKKP